MSFVEWVLSSATVFSSWLSGGASLAALACLLWSREWRTHINVTLFVALGGSLLTFMVRPDWWTVPMACHVEQAQVVLSCLIVLEVAWRSFGVLIGRLLPRMAFVGLVCWTTGYSVRYFARGSNSCMRDLVAWCFVAFGLLTEIRMEIEAHRLKVDNITDIVTRKLSWVWACAMLYRGIKEFNPMDGEFFGFIQVGIYCWAMFEICRATISQKRRRDA